MIPLRRVVLGVLCLALGVGTGAAQATSHSPANVSPDSTVPGEAAEDRVLELVGQLATARIEVLADPATDPLVPIAEPRSPMRLLAYQVAAMELELRNGAGIPIDELDAAVGFASDVDDGVGAGDVVAATPSAVITVWMDVGGTPASMLAVELVGGAGDQSVADLGLDVLPQIVLVLFASDIAIVGASLPEPTEQSPSGWSESDEPARPAQTGLCSSVIGFVNGVIGHLRNPPLVNTGFAPFDLLVNGVGKVVVGGVNAVIDGANFVISNTVWIAIGTVMSFRWPRRRSGRHGRHRRVGDQAVDSQGGGRTAQRRGAGRRDAPGDGRPWGARRVAAGRRRLRQRGRRHVAAASTIRELAHPFLEQARSDCGP